MKSERGSVSVSADLRLQSASLARPIWWAGATQLASDLIHRTSKLAGVSKTVTASHFRAPCRSLLRVAWRDASSDYLKALPALPTESKSATNARSLTQKTRIRYRLANLVPNIIDLGLLNPWPCRRLAFIPFLFRRQLFETRRRYAPTGACPEWCEMKRFGGFVGR